jgi:transketolase
MCGDMKSSTAELESMAQTMRRWILEQSYHSGVGHIGSALSVVEILAVLWGGALRNPGSTDPGRDRFLLGKGHAALALYAAMRYCGLIDEQAFATYCHDGTTLGVHPETALPGIELSTGSLGQALSVGCGIACGLAHQQPSARVVVLLSDAECNEGQVWEAVMFAAHHRLGRLLAIVDANGSQALAPTHEVLDLDPLARRFEAFGWDAVEADGHDVASLSQVLNQQPDERPRVVVARTHLGQGVDYMRDQVAWHYLPMSTAQYEQALAGIGGGGR